MEYAAEFEKFYIAHAFGVIILTLLAQMLIEYHIFLSVLLITLIILYQLINLFIYSSKEISKFCNVSQSIDDMSNIVHI